MFYKSFSFYENYHIMMKVLDDLVYTVLRIPIIDFKYKFYWIFAIFSIIVPS